jgi:hypothetical protein
MYLTYTRVPRTDRGRDYINVLHTRSTRTRDDQRFGMLLSGKIAVDCVQYAVAVASIGQNFWRCPGKK